MADNMIEVEIPLGWTIKPGKKPGTIMLRLRHKPFGAAMAKGLHDGTTLVLALSRDLARDLANDLLGKTAAEPRPVRLDS